MHPHTVALAAIERPERGYANGDSRCLFCDGHVYRGKGSHDPDCPWVDARRAVAEHQSAGMDKLVALSEELGLYDSEDTP